MTFSNYPPLDGLVDLACRDGVDVRPTLLRVLTDLYVQKPVHSADEEIQYVELALGLLDTVDDATRAGVAASLSRYPAAPLAVLAKIDATAPPSGHGAVAEMTNETAAMPRPATVADDLIELFLTADSAERRLILLNFDAAHTASAATAPPASNTIIARLESAAFERNSGEFSRTLSNALGIRRDLAERLARDHSGEPIVVAAKALGMKAAVLQRILLFLNPAVGQSVQRVHDLAGLFDELPRQAAERMLAIWRATGPASRPIHQPVYVDDEVPDARMQATPTRHETTRQRTLLPPLGKIIG